MCHMTHSHLNCHTEHTHTHTHTHPPSLFACIYRSFSHSLLCTLSISLSLCRSRVFSWFSFLSPYISAKTALQVRNQTLDSGQTSPKHPETSPKHPEFVFSRKPSQKDFYCLEKRALKSRHLSYLLPLSACLRLSLICLSLCHPRTYFQRTHTYVQHTHMCDTHMFKYRSASMIGIGGRDIGKPSFPAAYCCYESFAPVQGLRFRVLFGV